MSLTCRIFRNATTVDRRFSYKRFFLSSNCKDVIFFSDTFQERSNSLLVKKVFCLSEGLAPTLKICPDRYQEKNQLMSFST